jgi:hypothetical protein
MSEPDDHAWILQRERGEDVSHISARMRAGYDRLAALIEALPDEAPDPGWKQRIFASLDERPRRDLAAARGHNPDRRIWLSVGGLAAAATLAAVLALCSGGLVVRPPVVADPHRTALSDQPGGIMVAAAEPRATIKIRRSGTVHRGGDSASVGDTLVLDLEVDRPAELRMYGDAGEPLARCAEAPGCTVERSGEVRRFELELVLRASGTVRAVLFTGDSIPGTFQDLHADLEAAQRANVEARQVAVVRVQ